MSADDKLVGAATEVDSAEPSMRPRSRPMATIVARLAGTNLLVLAMAFATGPIQARALGPDGRGELAAILQPLQVIIWLLDLGLNGFVARERARGTDAGTLYGTVSVLSGIGSLAGVAAAIPLAHVLGQGRPTVVLFLEIGLFMAPVSVILLTVSGAVAGEGRWGAVGALTIVSPLVILTAFTGLFAAGLLTVTTAAIANFVAGLVGSVPIFLVLAGSGRWRWQAVLARRALRFGAQNWMANLAILGNSRLDQLLMAGITSSRQLGLYAVAASLSGVTSVFVNALVTVLFPRMAGGDQRLIPQVSRIAVLLVAVSCVAIAAIAPVAVPLVYGAGFSAAVPMLLILLLNPIPGTVVAVLSSALTGSGRPGATLKPQAVGLLIGAPLLVVLLPRFGGLGAAGITVLSSCITASLLLREAPKAFGGSFREYIFPTLGDLGTLRKRIQLELF